MLLINSEHQGLDHSLKFTVHFHIGHLIWSWPDAYEGRQAGVIVLSLRVVDGSSEKPKV